MRECGGNVRTGELYEIVNMRRDRSEMEGREREDEFT